MEGAELVKVIRQQNPDATIEEILDKARLASLEQIFIEIRELHFKTPVHIVEELCDRSLTLEDTQTVMKWMAEFNNEIREDILRLIDSQSLEILYKFCQSELESSFNKTMSCCMRFRCTSSKGRRNQPPS
jgi:hypothetical protein